VAGGDVRRLLDADHANLQALWKSRLEQHGWEVSAEATFNHFGERGSIDLLAWHAATSTLLVIEIKTVVVDVQDLLAGVDRKVRIGDVVARKRGWSPRAVVPGLMVAEGTSVRRRITDHASLFAPFSLRGRSAVAWLADPVGPAPSGILCLTKLPNARPGDRRRAGRQRIRLRRAK
jgi:hypothetical protein